jgi:KipI family sensor histidine kinase inhibitor
VKKFPIKIKAFGKQALLIEWPQKVDTNILADILRFERKLGGKLKNVETVPSYNSLTIIGLKDDIDTEALSKEIYGYYDEPDNETERPKNYLWKLPVCYDPGFGPDLKTVADYLQITIEQLIEAHTSHEYTVYGIGFLPGFMYLGGLPENLKVPRRPEPRLKVAKGSVGLAGEQTGIYPQESPGGWQIIGNCPIPIFNAKAKEPCLVSVGDRIKFESITKAEYDLHKIEGEVGIFNPEKIALHA